MAFEILNTTFAYNRGCIKEISNMTISDIIAIIAIIFSPIIAVVIGELLRKRNFEKQKRLDILYDLIAYRDKVESVEFLRALNSLKLFFSKENELKRLVNDLYKTTHKRDRGEVNAEVVDNLLVKIIKYVCDLEGFRNIAEEEIKKLFKKK